MNPKVDFYFNKADKWQQAIEQLRLIVLDSGLKEELKWGCPCYQLNDSNIVLIHIFKDYCALLFFKGALLKDPQTILVQQTKNVQATRQIRFTNVIEALELAPAIKAYIKDAIEVEKAGLKVAFKAPTEFEMAEEFKDKLETMPALKKAFEALTPGRQRAYLLHFSAPKLSKTKLDRVEKCIPQILKGKGLNE